MRVKGEQSAAENRNAKKIYKIRVIRVFSFFTEEFDSFAADLIESSCIKYENTN